MGESWGRMADSIGELVVLVLAGIGAAFFGRIKTWWKDRALKRFERGINQNVRLRELLSELRVPYSADRVCLYQFHNGDYYHSGESIMKCSLTHFVTKVGVANPIAGEHIPSTQMIMSLKALQESLVCEFTQDSGVDDTFIDSVFTASGTHTILATAVRDNRRNWIGILFVAWISKPNHAEHASLISYSKQIGDFLSTRPY